MSGDTELVGELYLSPKEAGVLITIYSSCFAQGRTAARRGCSRQAIAVSCLDKRLPVPSASLQQGRSIAILSELDSPLAGIIRSRPSKRSRSGVRSILPRIAAFSRHSMNGVFSLSTYVFVCNHQVIVQFGSPSVLIAVIPFGPCVWLSHSSLLFCFLAFNLAISHLLSI